MKYFLLIFIISSSLLYGQDYWLRHNSPSNADFLKCTFVDSLYGWISGDSGIIMNTTNAGLNWAIQQSGVSGYKIEEIFFLNRRLGWAIFNDYLFHGTNILKTTNGGFNWVNSVFPDSSMIFNTLFFLDSLSGYISGQTGQIFKTSNGGTNWQQCTIDSAECPYLLPKFDIYFANAQTGFACGGAIDYTGIIWKTNNGGVNWAAFCLTPEPLNVIKSVGLSKIGAMGGDFDFGTSVVYSSSSGNNWIYELSGCFGAATGFSFRTPAEVWAALSFSNLMALNVDSMKPGTSWQCIPTPENSQLYDVVFTTPTLGWAVGKSGAIFKYNTSVIGISGNHYQTPSTFKLYQNYPNPFNPVTKIRFSLPNPSRGVESSTEGGDQMVKFIVYDVLGREVASLILSLWRGKEGLSPGVYEIDWDGSNQPSGVYFYMLEAHGFRASKKMVLLK